MTEELRVAKNLMTVATVDQLVAECLGRVRVLAIVGACRTGKTWATKDWVASRENELEHVAYVDCQPMVFERPGIIAFDEVETDLRKEHYPRFALDGIDVVVVDEPRVNPAFVKTLLSRTMPETGIAAHRLVVLLIQQVEFLKELGLNTSQVRCYSTAGLPIRLASR